MGEAVNASLSIIKEKNMDVIIPEDITVKEDAKIGFYVTATALVKLR